LKLFGVTYSEYGGGFTLLHSVEHEKRAFYICEASRSEGHKIKIACAPIMLLRKEKATILNVSFLNPFPGFPYG
jgi:hypothetical protein